MASSEGWVGFLGPIGSLVSPVLIGDVYQFQSSWMFLWIPTMPRGYHKRYHLISIAFEGLVSSRNNKTTCFTAVSPVRIQQPNLERCAYRISFWSFVWTWHFPYHPCFLQQLQDDNNPSQYQCLAGAMIPELATAFGTSNRSGMREVQWKFFVWGRESKLEAHPGFFLQLSNSSILNMILKLFFFSGYGWGLGRLILHLVLFTICFLLLGRLHILHLGKNSTRPLYIGTKPQSEGHKSCLWIL